MKVKLTQVYRDEIEGGLRTKTVIGDCQDIPVIGQYFQMLADPLGGKGVRLIRTSPITEMDVLDHIITIHTKNNSIYTVEVLDPEIKP